MGLFDVFRSSLERDVEEERAELRKLVAHPDDSQAVQMEGLGKLADKVGASTGKLNPGYGPASAPEVIQNIHQALQTKAMIAAVRTSSNYLIVTVLLTGISFLSMLAAWCATMKQP